MVETYPSDVTKKVSLKRKYNYDSNGEVALTKANLNSDDTTKDYQNITVNGETKAWAPTSYKFFETDKRYDFSLNIGGTKQWGNFSNYDPSDTLSCRKIALEVKGVILPNYDDNNAGTYKNRVRIEFPNAEKKTPFIQVELSGSTVTNAVTYKIASVALDNETTLLNAIVTVKDASGNTVDSLSNVALSAALSSSYWTISACHQRRLRSTALPFRQKSTSAQSTRTAPPLPRSTRTSLM